MSGDSPPPSKAASLPGGVLLPLALAALGTWVLVKWFSVDVLTKGERLGWLIVLGVVVAVWTATAVGWCLTRPRRTRIVLVLANLAAAAGATMLLLILAEVTLMYTLRCHAVGYSLAAKSWFEAYWHLNSAGFREREVTPALLAGRRIVVVLGDSFAAGHGTADPADRFSNRLEGLLREDWLVLNYGVNGADSQKELSLLRHLPVRPDVVVLSYFGNDIRDAAIAKGRGPTEIVPYVELSAQWRDIVTRSYLLDFAYWAVPRGDLREWWSFYDRAYRDPGLRMDHEAELAAFARWSAENRVPLVVVLFPYLHDLGKSDVYLPWVQSFFEQRGIPVLNVASLVTDLSKGDRIVNANDVHPSLEVHRRVAEGLLPMVRTPRPVDAATPDPRGPANGK